MNDFLVSVLELILGLVALQYVVVDTDLTPVSAMENCLVVMDRRYIEKRRN